MSACITIKFTCRHIRNNICFRCSLLHPDRIQRTCCCTGFPHLQMLVYHDFIITDLLVEFIFKLINLILFKGDHKRASKRTINIRKKELQKFPQIHTVVIIAFGMNEVDVASSALWAYTRTICRVSVHKFTNLTIQISYALNAFIRTWKPQRIHEFSMILYIYAIKYM